MTVIDREYLEKMQHMLDANNQLQGLGSALRQNVAANIPVGTGSPLSPFQQALRQVGMPYSTTLHSKANGDVVLDIQNHMTETAKWHRAFIKVFEFMAAQINMDLFKDDPECKAIYTSWVSKGLHAMRDEGGGGVIR